MNKQEYLKEWEGVKKDANRFLRGRAKRVYRMAKKDAKVAILMSIPIVRNQVSKVTKFLSDFCDEKKEV